MQLRNDGLVLSFDNASTPGKDGLTVTVQPRSPSNIVLVHYRVNGGGAQTARASEIPIWSADQQSFRATFPAFPAGALVEYLPVCQNGGRQVPDASVQDFPASFRVPDVAPAAAETAVRSEAGLVGSYPLELEHIARYSVFLDKPEIIGRTPEGLKVNWWIKSGSFDGPRLRGILRSEGGDSMTIRPDGIGVMDVRATLETHDGALIAAWYSGLFELGEDGYENFLQGKYPKTPALRSAPRYLTVDSRYTWLNRFQCVGAGHVDMDRLNVLFDTYALH
jgi:Protein of unknown function (DUF3237)